MSSNLIMNDFYISSCTDLFLFTRYYYRGMMDGLIDSLIGLSLKKKKGRDVCRAAMPDLVSLSSKLGQCLSVASEEKNNRKLCWRVQRCTENILLYVTACSRVLIE